MNPAGWVTFLGVVITAVMALLGARSSAKAARVAAERSAEIERFRAQMEARDSQVAAWREDVTTLRRERDEDELRSRARVEELEKRVTELGAQLDALTVWVGTATGLLRGAGVDYPTVPHGRD